MLKKLLSFYIWICGLLTVGVTFFVFFYILVKGEAYLSPSFILDFPSGTPLGTAGGIFPAIVGSLLSGAVAAVCASLGATLLTVWARIDDYMRFFAFVPSVLPVYRPSC